MGNGNRCEEGIIGKIIIGGENCWGKKIRRKTSIICIYNVTNNEKKIKVREKGGKRKIMIWSLFNLILFWLKSSLFEI